MAHFITLIEPLLAATKFQNKGFRLVAELADREPGPFHSARAQLYYAHSALLTCIRRVISRLRTCTYFAYSLSRCSEIRRRSSVVSRTRVNLHACYIPRAIRHRKGIHHAERKQMIFDEAIARRINFRELVREILGGRP